METKPNKKFFLLIVLFMSFFCQLLTAQNISFLRFMQYKQGFDIKQIPSGGYYLTGMTGANAFVTKFDTLGFKQWTSTFVADDQGTPFGVSLTSDEGAAIVCTKNSDILFTRLDAWGNIISSFLFDTGVSEIGYDIVQTDDNGFLLLGDAGIQQIVLIKLDSGENEVWRKFYDMPHIGFNPKIRLVKVTDGSYLLHSNKSAKVFKVDEQGLTVWENTFESDVRAAASSNSFIYFGLKNKKILKTDFDGSTLGETTLSSYVYELGTFTDNSFIVGEHNKIVKMNESFESLWEIELDPFYPRRLIETSDGGMAAVGNSNSGTEDTWLLKTNPDGNFSYLVLLEPQGGGRINCFNSYSIQFDYFGDVDFVDLWLSTDGGQSWNSIVQNYDASGKSYDWAVPYLFSDSCKLKINLSSDPDVFDVSQDVFAIAPWQFYDYISENEALMWIGNNGDGSHDPRTDGNGYYWPGGIDAVHASIFEDGLLFGGIVSGEIRVGGNTHRQGLRPGIIENGNPADPNDPVYKIYKINRDWWNYPPGNLYDRLAYDYNSWPGENGAPFVDVNQNGIFDPGIDKPMFIGDEVLYYTANDADTTTSTFLFGSAPIGLEFHTTVWAYDSTNFLKDVVFKKYTLINKSGSDISDMFLSYWADCDLGDAGDDYSGCDPKLNLGFTYNADNNDSDGGGITYGTPPPAVGHLMAQGPITQASENDSAYYNDEWIHGFKNMPMTAFSFFIGADATYRDPQSGVYEGTLEVYNYMQGLFWDGSLMIDPNTGDTTNFVLSGDPVNGNGWYEGAGWPGGPYPGDVRHMQSTGPFNLAAGDTQEVVYAIFMALGSDNISSVAELKSKANLIQDFYNNKIINDVKPNSGPLSLSFSLEQNFPNPFNPATVINYQIPKSGYVSLKVFDLLGREVAVLVSREQKAGKYKAAFNGENMASGVYLYRLESGGYSKAKKMILLK